VLFEFKDCGNSRIKTLYYHFKEDKFYQKPPENYPITKTLVSRVGSYKLLPGEIDIKDYLQEGKFLEMPVVYTETIGIDRVLCAYAIYPTQKKKLIIDCGTFTTIDFVAGGRHSAGAILPGLKLIGESYLKGEDLMAPNLHLDNPSLTVHNTQSAIDLGAELSFITPIVHYIKEFNYDRVYLTGGASEVACEMLKKHGVTDKVRHEPNLIFIGFKNACIKLFHS
jgi:pantothenate kinase type III